MKTKRIITSITLLTFLTGCAGFRPVVDIGMTSQKEYETDLANCQLYAKQIDPTQNAVAGAAIGAAVGALLALSIAAALGAKNPGRFAGAGAIAGGSQLSAAAAAESARMQRNIIRTCLQHNGYTVLDWE